MDGINNIAEQIAAQLPDRLDSIITRHRDIARLYLATDEQIDGLARNIPPLPDSELRGAVSDWRLIAFDVTVPGYPRSLHVHLLGDNAKRGAGTKITSAVCGIDLASGQVATSSGSVYKLVGERGSGEPTLYQLLQVCGAFWLWGRGEALGVPHVWY